MGTICDTKRKKEKKLKHELTTDLSTETDEILGPQIYHLPIAKKLQLRRQSSIAVQNEYMHNRRQRASHSYMLPTHMYNPEGYNLRLNYTEAESVLEEFASNFENKHKVFYI